MVRVVIPGRLKRRPRLIQEKTVGIPLEHTPHLQEELQRSWQNASLKMIENGAPGLTVFEAMLVVGLAGLAEVEGKLATAQRLTHIAAQLAEQLAAERADR
jgi:hypothetical protein